MKTIIAIWNASNKGKSQTLKELAGLLISAFPKHVIHFQKPSPYTGAADFRLIIEVNGKIIAIETKGDPGTGLQDRLIDIHTTYNPDIILCSCRTRGETVNAIDSIASTHGYEQIWTSTYQVDTNQSLVNQLKAKHILELMRTLSLI
jgi:hypothetical protein